MTTTSWPRPATRRLSHGERGPATELVVDALEMARWRRQPTRGETVVHSDRGSQYTSWAFGHRLRTAGLLGSMGRSRRLSTTR